MEEVIEEARRLAEDGVRELNVIAQDTASYGVDIYGERCVHTLLRELCRIGELRWIRLLYAHPAHLYDELMDAVAEEEKVCPYVDVPLQHVSDRVLRRMGRGLARAESEELVSALRRRIPGVTLRTTFLTGFPGETEFDFAEALDFVREMRFERLGAFAYSPEEGTAAEGLPDQVPQEVAERRRDELMATQQEIAFELAAERVGERAEVLMEEGEPLEDDLHPARSPHEAPDVDPLIYVHAPAPPPCEFARVEIVDAVGYDCIARVVEEADHGAS